MQAQKMASRIDKRCGQYSDCLALKEEKEKVQQDFEKTNQAQRDRKYLEAFTPKHPHPVKTSIVDREGSRDKVVTDPKIAAAFGTVVHDPEKAHDPLQAKEKRSQDEKST